MALLVGMLVMVLETTTNGDQIRTAYDQFSQYPLFVCDRKLDCHSLDKAMRQ